MYRDEVPLLQWADGSPAVISSVSDRDAAALRELERLGLTPGVAVTVEPRAGASLSIRLADQDEPIRVSKDLAARIFVAGGPSRDLG